MSNDETILFLELLIKDQKKIFNKYIYEEENRKFIKKHWYLFQMIVHLIKMILKVLE